MKDAKCKGCGQSFDPGANLLMKKKKAADYDAQGIKVNASEYCYLCLEQGQLGKAKKTNDPHASAAKKKKSARSVREVEAVMAIAREKIEKVRPQVEQYRKEMFGNSSAPFKGQDEMRQWIKEKVNLHAEKAQQEVEAEIERVNQQGRSAIDSGLMGITFHTDIRLLEWPGANGWIECCHVAKGTILDNLRLKVKVIAEKLDCREALALVHILVGLIPVKGLITAKAHIEGDGGRIINQNDGSIMLNFQGRVQEDLAYTENYPFISSETSSQFRAEIKKGPLGKLIGWDKQAYLSRRPDLLNFVQSTPKLTWEERRKQWNKLYPDKQFDNERAMDQAYRRLKNNI
jgi:hypothetical protein